MKVLIHVPASVALKNGSDEHGYRLVDVPAASLTPEQRDALSTQAIPSWKQKEGRGADFDLSDATGYGSNAYQPIAFTADEAIKAVDALISKRAADAAKKAEEEAAAKAKHEARVQEWLTRPVGDFINAGYSIPELKGFGPWDSCIPHDSRLDGRIAEARAEIERIKAERAKVKAEAEAAKSRLTARLRDWAEAHGSDLLKARITEGFAWEELAEAEYGKAAFNRLGYPEADSPGDPTEKDCATPTLQEIEALRVVRKRIADLELPATASLKRYVYEPESTPDDYDYDEDAEPVKRNEIEITVTAPNGETRNYYVLPRDVK